MGKRWSVRQAKAWHDQHGWLVGCNYTPRTAINQLETWQSETFDLRCVRQELKWASQIGFNSIRLFLHDLVWQADARGFFSRFDKVLAAAKALGIGVMPVFFDSVWHPFPHAGTQREPEPGVHNSGWVQSPGVDVLDDEARFNKLERYVRDVISRYSDDDRIVVWDLWNEPDNANGASYGPRDLGERKADVAARLVPRVFEWARATKHSQPLTCGIWLGDWTSDETLKTHEKLQLENSDVVSFHCYGKADDLERRISQLQRYARPLLCTEYMSRGSGSTFESCLPVLRKHNVGAYCWGLVDGRTQTKYPWDSWQRPYREDPSPWFHEVFHADGTPYSSAEVETIRSLTRLNKPARQSSASKRRRGRSLSASRT